jgi:dihydroorotase (multifunctional complex type)
LIVDFVLTNAKAYINKDLVSCSIAIENTKIFKISTESNMPKSDKKIDLKNLIVLPGLIDPHVHLRDEGKSYKEDFYSGTAAAAAGGFTTVLDMPNNRPVTLDVETLNNRMRLAQSKILVNVGFYSEFPKKLEEIPLIINQGAIGFKLFMAHQIGGLNIDDDEELKKALTIIKDLKSILSVHAEDKTLLNKNKEKLKNNKKDDLNAFFKAHTEEVEYTAINRLLKLNDKIKSPLNFCHLTTKNGIELIKEAKKTNPRLTCETTPNHLLLSKTDSDLFGSLIVMMPPLRTRTTVNYLWSGLRTGVIDFIGSDHAPHLKEEKIGSNIWDIKVGLPGLETTLPLMLTMVNKHQITIGDVVLFHSENPAKAFKLDNLGSIQKGKRANLTILDLKKKHKINASTFLSKAKYSPYDGWEVKGRPVKTIVNGSLIMNDQRIIAKRGIGSIIRGNKRLNSF